MMRMKRVVSAKGLTMALLIFGASQSVLVIDVKADTLTKVTQAKYIVMATYNEPPHNWVEPSGGGYKGIDYELSSIILKRLGIETVDQIPVDWAGLIPGLVAGRWDMVAAGQAITKARATQVDFTKPIYQCGLTLIVPPGNPQKIMGRDEMPGKRIGGILGSTTSDYIGAIPDAEFVAYKSHPEMIADLLAGRVDAVLAGETIAAFAQAVVPRPVKFVAAWKGYRDQLYQIGFSFRKNDRGIVDYFDAELEKMKADGSLAAILKKYGLFEANIIR